MPRKVHSEARRIKILMTYHKYNCFKTTARIMRVDVKQVKRWVERFNTTGSVARLPGGGPKRKLSDQAAKVALQLLESEEMQGAAHVALELKRRGLTKTVVDQKTITRAALRVAASEGAPIRPVRGEPAKQLNNSTKEKRLAFQRKNLRTIWQRVMFTDRARFMFKHPGSKIKRVYWVRLRGKKPEVRKSPRAQSVNVYAGLTCYGMTPAIVVAGTSEHTTSYTNKKGNTAKNITAAEYEDVLKKGLLPAGAAIFSQHGVASWWLQQDNDPCHNVAARVLKQWEHRGTSAPRLLKDWPGHSPDLNPIENAWAWVKRQVESEGHKTFKAFRRAVLHWVQHVPLHICRRLVSSMPKRLQLVAERDGDKTGY